MKNILPKSALVSLSDKTNLDLLVSFLVEKNVEIISTGGTYKAIKKDRLLHFYPDNASITEIEVENGKISVISMKDVEKTIINV